MAVIWNCLLKPPSRGKCTENYKAVVPKL